MPKQRYDAVPYQTSSGVVAAGQTDVGKIRKANEDQYLIIPEPHALPDIQIFAAVADGMGGQAGGAIASSTAINALEQYLQRLPEPAKTLSQTLERAIKDANRAIQSKAISKSLQGMGTTITAAMVGTKAALIANVGDSRAYLLRNGTLDQITEDYSLAAEQVRNGLLAKEALETHPQRNILTRALGIRSDVVVDTFSLDLEAEDLILLCSDGLYPVVSHEEICRTLTARTAQEACDHLVRAANAQGGPDNITVVIIQVPHA